MDRVLIVNHQKQQCGVQQFGQRISKILRDSTKYEFFTLETESANVFLETVEQYNPIAVIYNWYPSTMSWANNDFIRKNQGRFPQLAIWHEIQNDHFDYYIHADPTGATTGPDPNKTFLTGRPLPAYNPPTVQFLSRPVIGSFGFGFGNKHYNRIVDQVQKEFDDAIIRLHITFAYFGDQDGKQARSWHKLHRQITKPGIILDISHDFLTEEQLLYFLANNTINMFPYEYMYGRGIASTIDYALAARRPIAITDSYMFRHIINTEPSINIEKTTLKDIIANGTAPLEQYYKAWSQENFIKDYEHIIQSVTS